MAVLNYYLQTAKDGNFDSLTQTAPTGSPSWLTGWTVAKTASGNSSEFNAGATQASGTFSSQTTTPKPASFVTSTSTNAMKIEAALTGTFANTAWSLTFPVGNNLTASSGGRPRMRVFKSVNASGASATELTSATVVGSTITVGSGATTATISWSPGATITLTSEFLFFVFAWEITTAGTSNSAQVLVQAYGTNTGVGVTVTTPDFSTGGGNTYTKTLFGKVGAFGSGVEAYTPAPRFSLIVPDPRTSRRGALPQRILR